MVVNCREVWREISNYIEGDVDADLRAELEAHFAQCRRCTAVLDGTHNIIVLMADERAFTVPAGFRERLTKRLQEEIGV
jgi:anti-sigma factor RsiW